MLRSLTLEGVGPAKRLEVEFGDRLNLITGDNGLGKSFLLDIAWWALTETWSRPDIPVRPRLDSHGASIRATLDVRTGSQEPHTKFVDRIQDWSRTGHNPVGITLYARVDGGFALWDADRNLPLGGQQQQPFLFNSDQVWSGIEKDGKWRCNGLYRDWASWQREDNESFRQLVKVIEQLSPPGEKLRPGPLVRVSAMDSQVYPTVQVPYGDPVPVIHASAAIRRILALSYLIIWSWQEHLIASNFRGEKPSGQMVFLVDEIEAHLHPSWQRRILPSLLTVVESLQSEEVDHPEIQIIATTHSPLVCVSVESQFNEETDRLLDMDLDPNNGVRLESVPFHKLGTTEDWLVSRNFDLASTRSEEAERATRAAEELAMREPSSITKEEFEQVQQSLAATLPDTDSFWVIWRRLGEKHGWID